MNKNLFNLEHSLMGKLLSSSHPISQALLTQWKSSTINKIQLTGTGFFVSYSVPGGVPVVAGGKNFTVGNIGAKIPGLKLGAGFVLFVKNGVISTLEGYSYEESWPTTLDSFELFKIDGKDIDWNQVSNDFADKS